MYNIICFHKPEEKNGFLSNWYKSSFTDENNVTFSSAEQYMMYRKAMLFGDEDIARKVMSLSSPAEIKALGRLVRGFDEKIWDENKYSIVKHGAELKFSQNAELMERLMSFGECVFAECSVSDRVWGIGLSMTSPQRFSVSRWRGENLLGRALTEVSGNVYPIIRNGK